MIIPITSYHKRK